VRCITLDAHAVNKARAAHIKAPNAALIRRRLVESVSLVVVPRQTAEAVLKPFAENVRGIAVACVDPFEELCYPLLILTIDPFGGQLPSDDAVLDTPFNEVSALIQQSSHGIAHRIDGEQLLQSSAIIGILGLHELVPQNMGDSSQYKRMQPGGCSRIRCDEPPSRAEGRSDDPEQRCNSDADDSA